MIQTITNDKTETAPAAGTTGTIGAIGTIPWPGGTGTTTIYPPATDPFAEWQKRRDEFAKAAMVKLLEKKSLTFDEIAQMAYLMADKMIAQSVKPTAQEKDPEPPKPEEPMIPMDITIEGNKPEAEEHKWTARAMDDYGSQLFHALNDLHDAIKKVHDSDEYKQVFAVHQHMCGIYNGPTYTEELEMARSVLSKILSKEHKKP